MNNNTLCVYGSLRQEFGGGLGSYGAEFVSYGVILGKMYDLGYFPGIKRSENIENIVFVEIWKVNDELLAELDRYEGVPDMYSRVVVNAYTESKEAIPTFIYEYNDDIPEQCYIPSGDWVTYVIAKYEEKQKEYEKTLIDIGKDFKPILEKDDADSFITRYLDLLDNSEAWKDNSRFITIDFSNITKISPSFAFDVFGYFMCYAQDIATFHKKITLVNLTRVQASIINLELEQALKEM